jgi:hypothetical protein
MVQASLFIIYQWALRNAAFLRLQLGGTAGWLRLIPQAAQQKTKFLIYCNCGVLGLLLYV